MKHLEYIAPFALLLLVNIVTTPHPIGAAINFIAFSIYLLIFFALRPRSPGVPAILFVLGLPTVPVLINWMMSASINGSAKIGHQWAVIDGTPTLFGVLHTYAVFLAVETVALLVHMAIVALKRRSARRTGT